MIKWISEFVEEHIYSDKARNLSYLLQSANSLYHNGYMFLGHLKPHSKDAYFTPPQKTLKTHHDVT